MHPYRSLHVTRPEPARRAASIELRGLAVVLIVLGVLRLLPVIVAHDAFGAEATVAVAMISLGVLALSSLRRRSGPLVVVFVLIGAKSAAADEGDTKPVVTVAGYLETYYQLDLRL